MKYKIQEYVKLYKEIETLCDRIVSYYCQFSLLLDSMNGCTDYEKFHVEDDTLQIICTDRGYDCYDCTYIFIPLDELDNWKEYIQKLEDEKQEEHCKYLEYNEKQAKEKRRELYNQLKDEFE